MKPNSQQSKAILTIDRHVWVGGVAGSGKTTVLASKVAHLVRRAVVGPEEILVLCFTSAAAGALVEQTTSFLGALPPKVFDEDQPKTADVRTFWSFGILFLRRYVGRLFGYTVDFGILDPWERTELARRCIPKVWVSDLEVHTFLEFVSSCKNKLLYPLLGDPRSREAIESEAERQLSFDVFGAYCSYQSALNAHNVVDFDDLVAMPLLVLGEEGDCGSFFGRFAHVLVDDCQDLSFAQCKWLQAFAENGATLTMSSDDEQLISRRALGRGSFLDFLPESQAIFKAKLERNYRSTRTITSFAREFLGREVAVADDIVREDFPIELLYFPNYEAEAVTIVEMILKMVKGGEDPGSIAVLFRSKEQALFYEDVFLRYEVPYRLLGVGFPQKEEVFEVMSYVQLALNPRNGLALARVVDLSEGGIDRRSLQKILGCMAERNLNVLEAAKDRELLGALVGGASRGLVRLATLIATLRRALSNKSPKAFLERVLDLSGLLATYENLSDALASWRKLNGIRRFLARAEDFGERLNGTRLLEEAREHGKGGIHRVFAEDVLLRTVVDGVGSGEPSISLMTVADAKGLGFRNVFIVGLEEGVFPNYWSLIEEGLGMERGLFHVGVARAGRRLFLSASKCRRVAGCLKQLSLSRFVAEANSKHLLVNDCVDSFEPVSWGGFWHPQSRW